MSHDLGRRIREMRKVRQLSVRQLAERVSTSVSTMEKYESGDRNPGPGMVARIAGALGVGVERLTGQPYFNGAETEDPVQQVIPDLRRVLITYDSPDDLLTPPRPLPVLRAEVEHVSGMRRDGQYGPMGPLLPGLVSELTHVALDARDEQQREAFRQLAISYRAINSLAHKMGYHDLSLTAVERVHWAADRAGDPLMQATAGYLKAGAMVRLGSYGSARRILEGLIEEVERLAPERSLTHAHMAVVGSMLLKLAILEVRDGHLERAQERLAEARFWADRLPGDMLCYETSFGPTNVRIHEVAVLIDSGDTGQSLARLREWGAEQGRAEWEVPDGTVAERASHHHIDVAAAKLAEGDRHGSYADLLRARRLSPTHTRFHPTVRHTAATLVRLDRSLDESVAGLARWAGV